MSADNLLSQLSNVKQTGSGRWVACCPAHDDKSPSLSIRELDDGRVLIKCWAGCEAYAILAAVGLEFDALYPPLAINHQIRRERLPFNPADVLRCIRNDALLLALGVCNVLSGKQISIEDKNKLLEAASRLRTAGGLKL